MAARGWSLAASALALTAAVVVGSDGGVARPLAVWGAQVVGASWGLTGNLATTPERNFLGTIDNQPLELRVNGERALRLEPSPSGPNLIGGFEGNSVAPEVAGATVAGGGPNGAEPNRVSGNFGTVGGGAGNLAGPVSGVPTEAPLATVAGGANNVAGAQAATIGGGDTNHALGTGATVAGGFGNTAGGEFATVAGGGQNATTAGYAAIGGGGQNTVSGTAATVAGGYANLASGSSATVAGGTYNLAQGAGSFAAGSHARALHDGAFVWADSTSADIFSNQPNEFVVRASGGITLYSDAVGFTGVQVAPGSGAWSSVSDARLKANSAPADTAAILDRLAALPVSTWNYRSQDPSIRHLGPTAQDFTAAFGLGEDDTHINTIDAQGVALAAIQALQTQLQARDAQLAEQAARLNALEAQNTALEARLTALERAASGK